MDDDLIHMLQTITKNYANIDFRRREFAYTIIKMVNDVVNPPKPERRIRTVTRKIIHKKLEEKSLKIQCIRLFYTPHKIVYSSLVSAATAPYIRDLIMENFRYMIFYGTPLTGSSTFSLRIDGSIFSLGWIDSSTDDSGKHNLNIQFLNTANNSFGAMIHVTQIIWSDMFEKADILPTRQTLQKIIKTKVPCELRCEIESYLVPASFFIIKLRSTQRTIRVPVRVCGVETIIK